MLNAAGGCLCGSVRYRLSGEPVMVAVCHCRSCQRNTGSAFSTNIAMPPGAVTIEGDGLRTYESRAGEGAPPLQRSFCARCGSPICARGDAYPGVVFIKAGTLDDPSRIAPTVQLWCGERLSWVNVDGDVTSFVAGPA